MLWRFFQNRSARKKNRALNYQVAIALFTQWVESGRPRFEKTNKFNPYGHGFRKIGYGNNARAYLSPCGGFVLRITKRKREEAGYAAFLRLALKRQDNPYYPRIFAHLQSGNRQVVLMEALHDWDRTSEEALDDALEFRNYCDKSAEELPSAEALAENPHMQQAIADMHALIAAGYEDDLHMGNILCRISDVDEHPVLIDPVW